MRASPFFLPLARRVCPHAEERIILRLWNEGFRRKLWNYLWVEFLIARGSARLWGGKPYWLTVDPTNFCQLHCPFCPTGANRGVRSKAEMTVEHFRRLMDRLGPTLVHVDMINWGESILHKGLPDMIAAAKAHGAYVKLDANLNDMPPGTPERLVRSGLDLLSVSIDGLSQETYEAYRVGGRLEKVLANLREIVAKRSELRSATPWIRWQFLVFKHNEHEAGRVAEFARAVGVDHADVTPASIPGDAGYLWEWLPRDPRYQRYALPDAAPPAAETERARTSAHVKKTPSSLAFHARRHRPSHLFGLRSAAAGAARVRSLEDAVFLLRRYRELARDVLRRRAGAAAPAAGTLCKWPWAGMAVNPNGSVSPCCSIESENDDLGNVFAQTWSSLWNGRAYRAARRHVARYSRGRTGVRAGSDHVCERCTIIGRANFEFPREPGRDRPADA
jgi:MoaA/NifB/PqqE/SkfB family radical SAM enzyme